MLRLNNEFRGGSMSGRIDSSSETADDRKPGSR
jgi:hypothetical protein